MLRKFLFIAILANLFTFTMPGKTETCADWFEELAECYGCSEEDKAYIVADLFFGGCFFP